MVSKAEDNAEPAYQMHRLVPYNRGLMDYVGLIPHLPVINVTVILQQDISSPTLAVLSLTVPMVLLIVATVVVDMKGIIRVELQMALKLVNMTVLKLVV